MQKIHNICAVVADLFQEDHNKRDWVRAHPSFTYLAQVEWQTDCKDLTWSCGCLVWYTVIANTPPSLFFYCIYPEHSSRQPDSRFQWALSLGGHTNAVKKRDMRIVIANHPSLYSVGQSFSQCWCFLITTKDLLNIIRCKYRTIVNTWSDIINTGWLTGV